MAAAVWLTCGNSLSCCTAATHWAQPRLELQENGSLSEHGRFLQIQSFLCSPFWVVTITAVQRAFPGNSGLPASSFLSRSALAQLCSSVLPSIKRARPERKMCQTSALLNKDLPDQKHNRHQGGSGTSTGEMSSQEPIPQTGSLVKAPD